MVAITVIVHAVARPEQTTCCCGWDSPEAKRKQPDERTSSWITVRRESPRIVERRASGMGSWPGRNCNARPGPAVRGIQLAEERRKIDLPGTDPLVACKTVCRTLDIDPIWSSRIRLVMDRIQVQCLTRGQTKYAMRPIKRFVSLWGRSGFSSTPTHSGSPVRSEKRGWSLPVTGFFTVTCRPVVSSIGTTPFVSIWRLRSKSR